MVLFAQKLNQMAVSVKYFRCLFWMNQGKKLFNQIYCLCNICCITLRTHYPSNLYINLEESFADDRVEFVMRSTDRAEWGKVTKWLLFVCIFLSAGLCFKA